ncbi:MAG: hypothetical protein J7502_19230 [Flavisolibacter sp.]|nr:hypothetical protein [Flavisolibacter sp.]
MEEKQLSEQDSFLLIQQMIHTAKKEQKDDGRIHYARTYIANRKFKKIHRKENVPERV